MNKYRVEFQANGEGFQTIDEFMEINADSEDEAIEYAIDWMNENVIADFDDDRYICPEDMEWRAEEVEEV